MIIGQWTFVTDDPSYYGTQGEFSSSGRPGARGLQFMVKDKDPNFLWLGFGICSFGTGKTPKKPEIMVSALHDDMWKFNISSNQWAWISGYSGCIEPDYIIGPPNQINITGSSTAPVARGAASAWSYDNYIYLYGGQSMYQSSGTSIHFAVFHISPLPSRFLEIRHDDLPMDMD